MRPASDACASRGSRHAQSYYVPDNDSYDRPVDDAEPRLVDVLEPLVLERPDGNHGQHEQERDGEDACRVKLVELRATRQLLDTRLYKHSLDLLERKAPIVLGREPTHLSILFIAQRESDIVRACRIRHRRYVVGHAAGLPSHPSM